MLPNENLADENLAIENQEIELSLGDQRAVVSPFGAALRSYRVGDMPVLWGYSGFLRKKGGQGDVLIPFPGRIRDGKYRWEGADFQLERNDKDGPNAIHGFLRTRPWKRELPLAERELLSPEAIRFTAEISGEEFAVRGYPFSLSCSLEYRLDPAHGLKVSFSIRNTGKCAAPVGAGFHPYFTVGTERINEAQLLLPCSSVVEFERLLPTGRILPVDGSELDFRRMKDVGALAFNHCFGSMLRGEDGLARAYLRNPDTGWQVCVWMDSAFDYLVAYSGEALGSDARRSLAIEPMSCATDAFNHPEWGLRRLEPGELFQGNFGACVAVC